MVHESREQTEPFPSDDPFLVLDEISAAAAQRFAVNPLEMVLATADAAGRPSSRTVLLKGYDRSGFVFYTNSQSRKAQQMKQNPFVSLTFYFSELKTQVHIEGQVVQLPAETANNYFATRPRASQIGAWASAQSREIPVGDTLAQRYREFEKRFADVNAVPRPGHWNGNQVVPSRIAIWEEGAHRLHTRYCYTNDTGH